MHASRLDDDDIAPETLTRAVRLPPRVLRGDTRHSAAHPVVVRSSRIVVPRSDTPSTAPASQVNVVTSGTRAELASHAGTLGAGTLGVSPDALTLEDVVTPSGPGAFDPGAFAFSPDDAILTYLRRPPGSLRRQLYAYDIATGEHTLCVADVDDDDKTSTRESPEYVESPGGVATYSWPTRPDARPRVLIPHRDGAWVQDFVRGDAGTTRVPTPLPPLRRVAGYPERCSEGTKTTTDASAVLDPVLSPDGRWLFFIRDDELHVASCEVRTGDPSIAPEATRVTFGARGRPMVTHGLAEYAAREEMGRDRGAWWSPDGGAIAFARVDVSAVPRFEVRDEERVERHAYPFAGCENAHVRLGVVDVSSLTFDRRNGRKTRATLRKPLAAFGGWMRDVDPPDDDAGAEHAFVSSHPDTFPVTWLDVECGTQTLGGRGPEEEYLVDVTWTPSGKHVLAQIQARSQRRLEIVKIDARTGARVAPCPLLVERAEGCLAAEMNDTNEDAPRDAANAFRTPGTWLNISNVALRALTRSRGETVAEGDVVWASECTGYNHLYLVDGTTGARRRALTAGEWCVDRVLGVDETDGWVYFTGTREGPVETHLYRARLWPRDVADFPGRERESSEHPERLTAEPGTHAPVLGHAARRFADVHSNLNAAPTVTFRDVPSDGGPALRGTRVLFEIRTAAMPRPRLEPPSLVTLPAADGVTALRGALYLPDRTTWGPPPYPCVVFAYGGPKVQTVTDGWNLTSDVRTQLYRSRGYAAFKLDGRGSARRGLAFENAIAGTLGAAELEDQIAGVRWLSARNLIEPARVAIVGWSFGGFLAALAATTRPETFPVAVAGAPVTSWADYHAHYSERYMGRPGENPEDTRRPRVGARGRRKGGKMMLVHGMLDENVHFRHTARLVAAMERAGKRAGEYALLPFPFERHEPRGWAERMYLERSVLEFIEAALGKREG